MVHIKVEVISDVVCVWCFIGKRTLEKAITMYQKTYPNGSQDSFSVIWRPYYLNPDQSAKSIEKSEMAKIKFRGVPPEKMAAMRNRVFQIAHANNINMSFEGKIGSTRNAHRLIHLTQMQASPLVYDMLVEGLFKAYHEQERDISEPSVLKEVALEAGLQKHQVDEWLSGDQGLDEVDAEAKKNRQHVTTGVPTFIIQNSYRIDGAQDMQEFFEAFVQAREDASSS